MSNDKIFETFIDESEGFAESILEQIEVLKREKSNDDFKKILSNLKNIRSNSNIMDYILLGKFCSGIEEIFNAVLSGNLIFTELLNQFLVDAGNKLIEQIKYIKENKIENRDEIEKWITDCDKIVAGMILENQNVTTGEEESDSLQGKRKIVVTNERLDEMLRSFEDISIQKARLKQQAMKLEDYDSFADIEYSHLRKNILTTVQNLDTLLQNIQEQLLEVGMVPLSSTLKKFKNSNASEECKIEIEETNLVMDKMISAHLVTILNSFLHNSKEYAFHGVENPSIHIGAKASGPLLELTFKDNGNGIDYEQLRANIISNFPKRKKEILEMDEYTLGMFLFTNGMTTMENGLHLAYREIKKIKGRLRIHSVKGEGTSFTIVFPKSLSVEMGFIVKYEGQKYFIPSHYVLESVDISKNELISDTSKPYFIHRDQKIRTYRLSSILATNGKSAVPENQNLNRILIIEYLEMKIGLIVDEIIGFFSQMIKSVPVQLKGIQEVEGMIIDEDYGTIPVLNVPMLIKRFSWLSDYDFKKAEVAARRVVNNVLVVDSSIFARQILRSIYEMHGCFVVEAGDGIEALEILKKKTFSLIISAVDLPRMNGVILLENVMRNSGWREIPVVLFPYEVTNQKKAEYEKLGARFVVTKNNFDRSILIERTKEFIHE